MKINYDKKMQEIIGKLENTDEKPVLLLHACCAPCASYPLEELSKSFRIILDFYNPNIATEEEFDKRLAEAQRLIKELPEASDVSIIADEYDHNEFLKIAEGLESEPERGARCLKCYELRLNHAKKKAEERQADYFATTLTLSPLKNSQVINKIGESLEESVPYLYSDFKKREGFKRSTELSKKYNLYRQDFCGCEFSKRENEEG